MKTIASVRAGLIIAAFLFGIAFDETDGRAVELQIDIFSGLPDPRVALEGAELAQIQRLLAEASPAPTQDPNTAFGTYLGFRGMRVLGWPANDGADSLRLHGKHALLTSGGIGRWFRLPNTKLETYLADLALAKGAITDHLREDIRLEIEKRASDTLFLDDFRNRQLDPVWSGPLPATTNTWPRELYLLPGPPDYRFETMPDANVLRLTNSLAPNERRGWSTTTNFSAANYRCEVRFNTLGLLPSDGGILEVWIFDARNLARFDFTSIFLGFNSGPIHFAAASSAGGDRDFEARWFDAEPNAFYRLLLEGSLSNPTRAALLTDAGEEIFSRDFQHTIDAFPDGIQLGISQCGKPTAPRLGRMPAEVAIDFVHLTGTDFAAAERRKTLYDFATWGGKTTARYDNHAKGWTPDFRVLRVTNFLVRAEGSGADSEKAANYIFADPDDPEVCLRLRTWEGASVPGAHLAMLDQLGLLAEAEPEPLPLASTIGLSLGDRSYLSGPAANAILFARNNVFICISEEPAGRKLALSREPGVRKIARLLDSQIAARGFNGPALLQPRLSPAGLSLEIATTAGQSYNLEFKDSISATDWTLHSVIEGDGTIRGATIPTTSRQKFLRMRVE